MQFCRKCLPHLFIKDILEVGLLIFMWWQEKKPCLLDSELKAYGNLNKKISKIYEQTDYSVYRVVIVSYDTQ